MPLPNLEISDLADIVARAIDEAIEPLQKRIAELERAPAKSGVPAVTWLGVWKRGVHARIGHLITWSGALWLCVKDCDDPPNRAHDHYVLIVKQGAFSDER